MLDTLRDLDPALINPLDLDVISDRLVEGMTTDVVFLPAVTEGLLVLNPVRAKRAFESGNLTLQAHDDLPFGLTLCDDRIGAGAYSDDTGLLQLYVDTDSPDVREQAEAVYVDSRGAETHLPEYEEFSGS